MSEVLFDDRQVRKAFKRMARAMRDETVYLVGIRRGGSRLANALQKRLRKLGCEVMRGDLDISFYRDDLECSSLHPIVHGSELPGDISDRHVWLVDDVLYTGRTVRAALDELFDYGRPASVSLAVLIDRGGRELPIQADLVGLRFTAPEDCVVDLHIARDAAGKTVWSVVRRSR